MIRTFRLLALILGLVVMSIPASAQLFYSVEVGEEWSGVFPEASGLGGEIEVVEVNLPGGGVAKSPGRVNYSNITLKRGVTVSSDAQDWFQGFADGSDSTRQTVVIRVLDSGGKTVAQWTATGCFPVSYSVSQDAEGSVSETLVIACNRVARDSE